MSESENKIVIISVKEKEKISNELANKQKGYIHIKNVAIISCRFIKPKPTSCCNNSVVIEKYHNNSIMEQISDNGNLENFVESLLRNSNSPEQRGIIWRQVHKWQREYRLRKNISIPGLLREMNLPERSPYMKQLLSGSGEAIVPTFKPGTSTYTLLIAIEKLMKEPVLDDSATYIIEEFIEDWNMDNYDYLQSIEIAEINYNASSYPTLQVHTYDHDKSFSLSDVLSIISRTSPALSTLLENLNPSVVKFCRTKMHLLVSPLR